MLKKLLIAYLLCAGVAFSLEKSGGGEKDSPYYSEIADTEVFYYGRGGKYVVVKCEVKYKPGKYGKGVGMDGGYSLTMLAYNGRALGKKPYYHETNVDVTESVLKKYPNFWKDHAGKTVWLGGYFKPYQVGVPDVSFEGIKTTVPQVDYHINNKFVILDVMDEKQYQVKRKRIDSLCEQYNKTIVNQGKYTEQDILPRGRPLIIEGDLQWKTDASGHKDMVLVSRTINGKDLKHTIIVNLKHIMLFSTFMPPPEGEVSPVKLYGYVNNYWTGTPPAVIIQSLLDSGKNKYDKKFEPYRHTAIFMIMKLEKE